MDAQGKGLWSEVVRRKEASTSTSVEDVFKEQLILSEAVSEAEDDSKTSGTTQEASTISPLNGEGADASAVCNGERDTSSESMATDLNSQGAEMSSQTSLKSAWKKPGKSLIDSCDGAVMGSESWPSLADSLTMKPTKSPRFDRFHNSSDEKSEKEPSPATVSSAQGNTASSNRPGNVHVGQRMIESGKQGGDAGTSISIPSLLHDPFPPAMVPVHRLQESMPVARAGNSASGNNVGQGRIFNQRSNTSNMFDDALTPQRYRNEGISSRGGGSHRLRHDHEYLSAPGGMHNPRFNSVRQRAPHQRGNGGASRSNFGNRRVFRDQGRGNNNWQPQQFYADGPNHVQPFQQPILYPRSFLWSAPTVFHPSFGYINHPVPEGIYYPPITSPSFPQGAGYYAPPEAPLVPPPASQDNSPLSLLAKQIEYYFSDENLVKDVFLRSNMDAEGFVPASLIASFNLIRTKNADTNMILEALQNSVIVEVEGDKLRKRYSWQFWLPTNQHRSSETNNIGGSVVDVALELLPQSHIEAEH